MVVLRSSSGGSGRPDPDRGGETASASPQSLYEPMESSSEFLSLRTPTSSRRRKRSVDNRSPGAATRDLPANRKARRVSLERENIEERGRFKLQTGGPQCVCGDNPAG